MSQKLTIERNDDKDISRISFKGIIDEDADFKDAFSQLKPQVELDFEGVELINSCGVREWIHTMKDLKAGLQLTFIKCSPRIVEQINYIANFMGPGKVESFFAPYFCSKCNAEFNILLNIKDLKTTDLEEAPPQECPKCHNPMEFDDIEDEYFAFMTGD